jgi:hypothetical protein
VLVIPPVSWRGMSFLAANRVPSVFTSLKISRPANDTATRRKTVAQVPLSSFLPLHIRVDLCKKAESAVSHSKRVTAGVQGYCVMSQ